MVLQGVINRVRIGSQCHVEDSDAEQASHHLSGAEGPLGEPHAELVGEERYDIGPRGHKSDGKPGPSSTVHFASNGTAGGEAGGTEDVEEHERERAQCGEGTAGHHVACHAAGLVVFLHFGEEVGHNGIQVIQPVLVGGNLFFSG